MRKKQARSSSSSSEEDFTAFQSVAVSFEEITSNQKEVAEQAKQRIAGTAKRKRRAEKKTAGAGDDCAAEYDSAGEGDDAPIDSLDPFQLKVAAALDSLLEGRLRVKEPGSKKLRREQARAAEAAVESDTGALAGGEGAFRFFARVPAGQPVVLQHEEPPPLRGTPFPELFHSRRMPSAEDAAAALPALAVDGKTLLAAAAAAGGAATAAVNPAAETCAPPAPATVEDGTQQQKKQKDKRHKTNKTREGKAQGQLGEGLVIDPRVIVRQDDRIRRLLGEGGCGAAAGRGVLVGV